MFSLRNGIRCKIFQVFSYLSLSCPNKQDETIKVLENGVSRQGRVSVQMFKFIGDYELVYLHCAVSLCEVKSGVCQPVRRFLSIKKIREVGGRADLVPREDEILPQGPPLLVE